jgi:hypothetical protein
MRLLPARGDLLLCRLRFPFLLSGEESPARDDEDDRVLLELEDLLRCLLLPSRSDEAPLAREPGVCRLVGEFDLLSDRVFFAAFFMRCVLIPSVSEPGMIDIQWWMSARYKTPAKQDPAIR